MSEVRNFGEVLGEIERFGMDEERWSELKMSMSVMSSVNPHLVTAYVEHLKKQNKILREGLGRIASGMLTQGESREQAQESLDFTSAL
jgi:hypothetical protein